MSYFLKSCQILFDELQAILCIPRIYKKNNHTPSKNIIECVADFKSNKDLISLATCGDIAAVTNVFLKTLLDRTGVIISEINEIFDITNNKLDKLSTFRRSIRLMNNLHMVDKMNHSSHPCIGNRFCQS